MPGTGDIDMNKTNQDPVFVELIVYCGGIK